jgi:hypothetical protein
MQKQKYTQVTIHNTPAITMPVYFGHPASEVNKVPDPLKKKGLNFLRTSPHGFTAQATPQAHHHYYDVFIGQLHMVLASVNLNRVVSSGDPSFVVGKLADDITAIPFAFPPLAVSFTSMASELEDYLRDNDFYRQDVNDVSLWCKDESVSIADIRFLISRSETIQTTRVPWMYVNIQACVGLIQIIKYATLLSIVLQFPALSNKSEYQAYNETGKRKRVSTEEVSAVQKELASAEPDVYEGQGFMSGVRPWLSSNARVPQALMWKVKDSHLARPASRRVPTFKIDELFTDSTEGLWFPFEMELAQTDSDGPIPLLSGLLYRNLGETPEKASLHLDQIKSAWGLIKRTDVGNQLAHLFRCFELAIQSQTGIRVLTSADVYEGVVLVGHRFVITTQNSVIRSLSKGALQVDMSSFKTHLVALAEIAKVFSGMDVDGDSVEDQITSLVELRRLILAKKDMKTEELKGIQESAQRLRFPRRRWQASPVNIGAMIDILAGKRELDSTVPISAEVIDEKDLLKVVLSAFGKVAPSFTIPDGRVIDLKKPLPVPINKVIEGKGKKPARTVVTNDQDLSIQVRLVEQENAYADWKWLIKNAKYRVASLQTARANGYKVWKGAERAIMFSGLQSIINKEATVSGGSRDEDVEEDKVKKGKVKVDSTFFDL